MSGFVLFVNKCFCTSMRDFFDVKNITGLVEKGSWCAKLI